MLAIIAVTEVLMSLIMAVNSDSVDDYLHSQWNLVKLKIFQSRCSLLCMFPSPKEMPQDLQTINMSLHYAFYNI